MHVGLGQDTDMASDFAAWMNMRDGRRVLFRFLPAGTAEESTSTHRPEVRVADAAARRELTT